MVELSKFSSKGDESSVTAQNAREVRPPEIHVCPSCGVPVPPKSRFCSGCGTFTDQTPEGLAAFSTGPQFALMKAQAASLEGIRSDVDSIRRIIAIVSVLGVLGFAFLMMVLFWITDHM